MCKDWAAVHADAGSGIWQAADLTAAIESRHWSGDRGNGSMGAWLERRASGLLQLGFTEDRTIYNDVAMTWATSTDGDEVGRRLPW